MKSILVLLPFIPALLFAQRTNVFASTFERGLDLNFAGNITKYEGEVVGSNMLFETPEFARVYLSVSNKKLRSGFNINLASKTVYLRSGQSTYVVNPSVIDSLEIDTSGKKFIHKRFLNIREIKADFIEVQYRSSAYSLYSYSDIKLIRPNYTKELNTGTKDTQLVRNEYFILINHKNDQIYTGKNLKKILNQMDIDPETRQAIRKQRLNPKDTPDFIKLLQFLNGQ